jgi:hypothetical protein
VQLHRGGPVDSGGDGLLQGTGMNTGAGVGGRVGREIRGGVAGSTQLRQGSRQHQGGKARIPHRGGGAAAEMQTVGIV